MNRSDLIRIVSRRTQLPQPQVEKVLDAILKTIAATLTSGEEAVIKNFGRFEVRERAPTTRRNPKTGEEVKVPRKFGILFHAAPALKEEVNERTTDRPGEAAPHDLGGPRPT